ncbi:terminase large subunit [Agrobacterium sp. 33MFTa1.1]|uniref:terminase large subunit n=1 Tax=Agrobacterium sp. 33MFTa1.1 TaxID=1279031 RepID=UPI00054D1765|nr:terminase TerL endonuclease subunit [Agrobacterium sp. 33MFTa1.1]QBJ12904.1 terminase large subunit [Agrobacterium sp. 33MFTa1.1]
MGRRGPGAKPKASGKTGDIMSGGQPKHRKVLPWEVEGLTRLEAVVAFVNDMKITQGKLAGQNMQLREWQIEEFLAPIYATDEYGRRPVRTAVLSMGRKNGKTGLSAALALCHLVGPEAEQRGELYFGAMDKIQAGKAWAECKAMLEAHVELSERVNIIKFSKEIEVEAGYPGEGSVLKAVSADADSKLGLSPSFFLADEAGYWVKRDLFDAMDSALGARDEPLVVVISTQAKDDTHFFSEMIDYGLKVKTGEVEDESFHLALFTTDPDEDAWSYDTWIKANPALGDFLALEQVERMAAQAQRIPSKEADFRNKILNQRIDGTVRFIAAREWNDCDLEPIDEAALEGRECYGALDLSAARDLTAFVLVFPEDDGRFTVLPRFFLPQFDIDGKSENDRVPYNVWARQADARLTLLPGKVIDPQAVAEYIADEAGRFDIKEIAFDRWRIEDLRRELAKASIELPLTPFGQGYKDMSPAVDMLEVAVAQQKVNHAGNPLLRMCAANAVVTKDPSGARKLDKSKASGRIDGLVALAMALQTAARHEEDNSLPACLMEDA